MSPRVRIVAPSPQGLASALCRTSSLNKTITTRQQKLAHPPARGSLCTDLGGRVLMLVGAIGSPIVAKGQPRPGPAASPSSAMCLQGKNITHLLKTPLCHHECVAAN